MARKTPSSTQDLDPSAKSSSVQFMLAEFGRIQAGEIYNRNNGESRVNLYITILTFVGAGIVTVWQLADPNDIHSLRTFYITGSAAFLFVSFIGTITLRLLVERWRLTVIYLRKLARIRRWFLSQDASLEGYLAYTTDETYPSFVSKGFLSSSLITLVSLLNSVSIAITVVFITKLLFPSPNFFTIGLLSVGTVVVVWLVQRLFALRAILYFQKDKDAAFPPVLNKKIKPHS